MFKPLPARRFMLFPTHKPTNMTTGFTIAVRTTAITIIRLTTTGIRPCPFPLAGVVAGEVVGVAGMMAVSTAAALMVEVPTAVADITTKAIKETFASLVAWRLKNPHPAASIPPSLLY